ncbi:MAG TPA: tetratricopeptide repeat protein, partial [Bryobacteraceae bacterium]|nr:tetratricopeptide repeat protein [Bryobacteraceae bacterium]
MALIPCVFLSVAMASSTATGQLLDKARALQGRGRMDLAVLAWEQVLLADPNQEDALANLARYAKQNGKDGEAKAYLNRLRRVNPNNPAIAEIEKMKVIAEQRSRLTEAERLAASQQYEQAMRIYREVFGDDPPAGGWALAYYETEAATPGGWEAATAGLQHLATTYPEDQEYRLALGRLYTYRPQTRDRGIQLLESIPQSGALANKARQAWRQALVWDGAHPASAAFYRSFLARYKDPELQQMLSEIKVPAAATVENKVDLSRGREEKLGYAALNADRLPEAEGHFQAALKESSGSAGGLSGLGFISMKKEDFDSAVDYFEQAKSAAPASKQIADALNTARFWKNMKAAGGAQKDNRLDAAAELFQQALAMRPGNVDAAAGLAGAYMQQGKAAPAIPLYQEIVHQQPQNAQAWRGLVTARYRTGNYADALATAKQMPDGPRTLLGKDAEYLALLAFIHGEAGDERESSLYLQEALEAARAQKTELPFGLQLEFAGLFLRSGKAEQAAVAFQRVADAHPNNVDAWEGLLSALIRTPNYEVRALSALRRMPKEAYSAALRQPAFLRSLASLYVTLKRLDLAEAFLEKLVNIEGQGGHEVSLATQLQLADVWVRASQSGKAEILLRRLAEKYSEAADVWKAWISMLHAAGRNTEALVEIQRIPPDLLTELQTDPGYVILQAAVFSRTGRSEEALEGVRAEIAHLEMDKQPIPAALETQLAWLLLGREDGAQELYSVLEQSANRRDLTLAQQQDFAKIWSIWIRRRAQADIAAGNLEKGIAILQAGGRLLPNDNSIRGNLAGNLLKAGQNRAAFDVYRNWGLADAEASDYLGAVGAALSVRDSALANQWLAKGLRRFPRDSKLLTLAGKQAALKGDYKKAEVYLRAALAALPKQEGRSSADRSPGLGNSDSQPLTRSLGQLLLNDDLPAGDSLSPVAPAVSVPASPIDFQPAESPSSGRRESQIAGDHARSASSGQVITEAAWQVAPGRPAPRTGTPPAQNGLALEDSDAEFFRSLMQAPGPAASNPALVPAASPPPAVPASPDSMYSPGARQPQPQPESFFPSGEVQPKTEREEIDDQIATIEGRNSPYFGGESTLQSRSGQSGYDKLIAEEEDLEVSTAINNQVRLTLIARPVFLDPGTADGTSTLRFGLLPVGVAPPSASANGIAADVQLSTPDFGLRFGSSPREFLVPNWIGGIRYRPANGHLTFLFDRDNVKDTMLSYSGSRDPLTNQIWGGVIANAYQVIGNWGDGNSGFYTNFSYQSITGDNSL